MIFNVTKNSPTLKFMQNNYKDLQLSYIGTYMAESMPNCYFYSGYLTGTIKGISYVEGHFVFV